MRKGLLLSFCMVCLLSTALLAGSNPNPKIAVHVREHNAKAECNYGTITGCEDIVYEYGGSSFDAFPVYFNLTEFLGCEYGLTWPTWTYGAAFTSCSDFVLEGVVNPGDGAAHTWTVCQSGVCVPAFVWLYADGEGRICPIGHPYHGFLYVLDCSEELDTVGPAGIGCAGVFGATGDDPCELEPIAPVTWGEIKGLFK